MNAAFSIAGALLSASIFWFLVWLIPQKAWDLLPENVLSYKQTVTNFLTGLIFVVVGYNALNTYGPRYELDKAVMPQYPEERQVIKSTDFIEPSDRVGQFDSKIQDEP